MLDQVDHGNGEDDVSSFPGPVIHNHVAQEVLVGQMILFPAVAADVRRYLKADHFYGTRLELIVSAIYDVLAEAGTVDIVLVAERIRRMGRLAVSGGEVYLMQLTDSVVSPAGALAHARIVLEYAICRNLSTLGRELMQMWDKAPMDVEEALKASRRGFDAIEEARQRLDDLVCHGISAVDRLNRSLEGK